MQPTLTPQQPEQLDPKVLNLAKAIRRAETGSSSNAYQLSGKSGEMGAYQFMPDTWKQWSKQYLGVDNAEMSVENQNKVAYKRIKEWKDQGYNPAQIASLWNTGSRPDAYKEGWKGVNAQGVEYDTPKYVERVSQYYREISGGIGTNQPQQPQQNSVLPQNLRTSETSPLNVKPESEQPLLPPTEDEKVKKPISNRIADFLGYGKTTETLGKLINRAGLLPQNEGQKMVSELTGMSQRDINREQIEAPSAKETAGVALNVASLGLGAGSAALAGTKLATGKLMAGLTTGIKGGALAGGSAGLAQGLEDEANLADTAKSTAIGTGIGILGGAAVPLASSLSGLGPATARLVGSNIRKLKEGAEGAFEQQVKTAQLPKAERAVIRSGLPETVLQFKNATPQTQKSFGKMLDIHKRGLAEPRFADQTLARHEPAKTLIRYVDEIKKKSDKASIQLNKIAESRPNEKMDFSPAFRSFLSSMESRGVRYNSVTGKFVSDGRVANADLKYYDDIMDNINSVVKGSSNLNRKQAHVLRQRLFDTLDAATRQGGKPGQRPFGNAVDNDVQVLRRELAKIIGPEYQEAARVYATNEDVLRRVAQKAGTTIDDIGSKDKTLAAFLMRSFGTREDIPKELIDDVLATAKANKIKTDVDIYEQLRFADLLERLYGSTQTRTFEGLTRRGTTQAIEDTLPDVAQGNITQAILRGGRTLLGKGESDQVRAFEDFVKDMNKRKGLIDL